MQVVGYTRERRLDRGVSCRDRGRRVRTAARRSSVHSSRFHSLAMVIIVLMLLGLTAVRLALSNAEKRLGETPGQRIRAAGESVEVLIIAMCVVFLVIR